MEGRITKRAVDQLVCPPGMDRQFLWDDTLSGFGVVIHPTGRRSYLVQYRLHGRSRRMSLGEHGRLTPEEARTQAKKVLGQVAIGQDPLQERASDRDIPTFAELAARYMATYGKTQIKSSSEKSYASKLRLHLRPALGAMRIKDIRTSKLAELMEEWSETPIGANRNLAVFSSIWNWAARTYENFELPICPATRVDKFPEEGGERFLSMDELLRLSEVLHLAETVGLPYEIDEDGPNAKHAAKPENRLVKIDLYVIAAIRLLIFTGARFGEIARATWDEIDLEAGTLTLTKERSKAKKKSKEKFKVIQLSSYAVDILRAIPRIEGNPHVICGSLPGRPRIDFAKPWLAIKRAANLGTFRIHDLRHSFGSVGAGSGISLHLLGGLMGHTQAQTTAKYAHRAADPLKVANAAIGQAIAQAMYPLRGEYAPQLSHFKAHYPKDWQERYLQFTTAVAAAEIAGAPLPVADDSKTWQPWLSAYYADREARILTEALDGFRDARAGAPPLPPSITISDANGTRTTPVAFVEPGRKRKAVPKQA